MHSIVIAVLIFSVNPTDEEFRKYFDLAAVTKAELIQKAKDDIVDHDSRVRGMSGTKLAHGKQVSREKARDLEELKDAKPFAFLDAQPKAGDMGMIKSCKPYSIVDDHTILATAFTMKSDTGVAILVVDSTAKIKVPPKPITPDYVWVVTLTHYSKEPFNSDGQPEGIRAAIRQMGKKPFYVAEAVNKKDLDRHRREYQNAANGVVK